MLPTAPGLCPSLGQLCFLGLGVPVEGLVLLWELCVDLGPGWCVPHTQPKVPGEARSLPIEHTSPGKGLCPLWLREEGHMSVHS